VIRRRRSGILIPLFSLSSTRGWGVGEFLDLPDVSRWLRSAGQSFLQILPITEIPEAETSPYSALTAMAVDPIYISLRAVEDFASIGGEGRMSDDDRSALARARRAPRVDHPLVRSLKSRALRRCFAQFQTADLSIGSPRAQRFQQFTQAEADWLDDYALFQALRGVNALLPWWEWSPPLARREPDALRDARDELHAEINYRKYVQWIAAEQWAAARQRSAPLQIFGDVPFMISADSPDVWTQQNEFIFDGTVGVPPDAFSETGQDWGLPPWRWEVMAQHDFDWMKRRARRTAALFDGFRLDHLVGLYRTYIRPKDASRAPYFAPADEPAQLELGEKLVRIYQESGAEIVAEDLGTVPDFVRASLARLEVPGFKVLRWERRWNAPGQPYIDTSDYPEISVATTGTHDTEPLATWWASLDASERDEVLQMAAIRRYLGDDVERVRVSGRFDARLNDALLRALLDAASELTIIPVQDLFGWTDRINTPATVDAENWSWRMPWPVDRLDEIAEARSRAEALREWSGAASREVGDDDR
jgi:4-alpha-glucanotransferase